MHSFMSPLYVGVCKNIRLWQIFYKGYIGPCMKRLGSTPIIPACKHSGIKNKRDDILVKKKELTRGPKIDARADEKRSFFSWPNSSMAEDADRSNKPSFLELFLYIEDLIGGFCETHLATTTVRSSYRARFMLETP